MHDIITFGSATKDIFLKVKGYKLADEKKFITGKGLCFSLGSKLEIEKLFLSSGGGGTNTAATFAKQGFKTAFCGMVGDDISGREIIEELKQLGIDTQFVLTTKKALTNHSIIISSGEGLARRATAEGKKERTILVYRGASSLLEKNEIPWLRDGPRITGTVPIAKLFYLAPLSGKLAELFEELVDFAKNNGIKIAANPGNSQLSLPRTVLKKTLAKIDILILNQEEASFFTKVPYKKEKEIFKKIDEMCSGIVIMTKGSEGVAVSDGKQIFSVRAPKSKVVDRTGAGDSFASGFVSGFLQKNDDVEYAIQLGIANSTACLTKLGAKNGLLAYRENFNKVIIKRAKI